MKHTLLFFLISLPLLGCNNSSSTDDNTPQGGSIVPLKVGNRWTYMSANWGIGGSQSRWTIEVIDDTLINAETWYKLWEYSLYPFPYDSTYNTNRADGYYLNAGEYGAYSPELDVPYPAVVGTKRVNRDTIMFTDHVVTDSMYLNSTNAVITTPAGTFTCYEFLRFAVDPQGYVIGPTYWYYAPNVGFIRTVEYFSSPDSLISYEIDLQEYELQQ